MIAAEGYPFRRQPLRLRQLQDEIAEVGRAHPGVPTELVDLVAGRLEKGDTAVVAGLGEGGPQHQRVRGTDRGDADALTRLVAAQDVEERGPPPPPPADALPQRGTSPP